MSSEPVREQPASGGRTGAGSADASTELAMRRTGMSFQRTRMSADRTLMSVIRTSLSLIGFGFTIFQFFQKLHASEVLKSSAASRNFGQALVWLGIAMLISGIAYHARFMLGLRRQRQQMKAANLLHADSDFPASMTLIVALLLLAIGFMAIFSMNFDVGPFGG
jgi:putative membrane protein